VRIVTLRCQTNLVLSVRSDILPGGEKERQRSVASEKWPCSRLLLMSWPGGASRPIAVSCPCEASRAIAGFGRAKPRDQLAQSDCDIACSCRAEPRDILLVFPGCARSEAGLVCLRPSERSESAPPLFADRGSGVERSAKLASPARALVEQCRYLPRTFSGKCRLCEAWVAVLRRDSGVANFFREAAIFSFHA